MNDTLDLWVRRATLAAILALGASLLGLGLAFYAPAPATPQTVTAARH